MLKLRIVFRNFSRRIKYAIVEHLMMRNKYVSKHLSTNIKKYAVGSLVDIEQHTTVIRSKKKVTISQMDEFDLHISESHENILKLLKPYQNCDNYYYLDKNYGIVVLRTPRIEHSRRMVNLITTPELMNEINHLPFKSSMQLKFFIHIRW